MPEAISSDETASVTDLILDTSGLNCPLPFLKLRKALRGLAAGVVVEVRSTDPLAPGDFRELCEALGHAIIATRTDGAVTHTLIRVKAAPPQ